jgi:hypothetical protein
VLTDPSKPRQPLPAHDGADYLKTIPGFSVIRKGGTDGDAVFRGMAGSRVVITTTKTASTSAAATSWVKTWRRPTPSRCYH